MRELDFSVRKPTVLIVFALLSLYLLSFIQKNTFDLASVYFVQFILICSLFIKKPYSVFSLFFFSFFFFNVYLLVPILSYFITGFPVVLDDGFTWQNFNVYIRQVLAINQVLAILLFFIKEYIPSYKRIRLLKKPIPLILMALGVLLLYFQFYYSGALAMIGTTNKPQILTVAFSMSKFYEYLFYPGYFFFIRSLASRNEKGQLSKLVFVLLFGLFSGIWFVIGHRGPLVFLLIFGLYSFSTGRKIIINLRLIAISGSVALLVLVSSIAARWDINATNISRVVQIVRENPEVINLGNLEYSWAIRNFNTAYNGNFNQDFFLESYVAPIVQRVKIINGEDYYPPIKRFRNIFHLDRLIEGGEFGATGFSIVYEAIMSFGFYFSWIPFLILFYIFSRIDRNCNNENNLFRLYLIFLLPNLIMLARSGMPVVFFVTKFIYASIFLIIIQPFLYQSPSSKNND